MYWRVEVGGEHGCKLDPLYTKNKSTCCEEAVMNMEDTNIKSKVGILLGLKKHGIGYMLTTIVLLAWTMPVYGASSLESLMHDVGLQQPKVHKLAPDFTLHNLSGTQISLSDFRGQVVLVHFWATWCVPCQKEMPLLHALDRQHIDGFHILCVNVDRNNKGVVQSFVDEVTPHFQTLLDPNGEARNHYAVRGLPTSYLIDSDGKIIGRIIGERDWSGDAATQLIQALLRKKKQGDG